MTTWDPGVAFTYVRTAQDEIDRRFGAHGYDKREYLELNRAHAAAHDARDFEALRHAVHSWVASVEDRVAKAKVAGAAQSKAGAA